MKPTTILLTGFLMVFFLAGCAADKRPTYLRTTKEQNNIEKRDRESQREARIQRKIDEQQEARSSYFAANPKLSSEIVTAINNGQVIRGMTETQVTLAWGPPESVNRSVSAAGEREQWIYDSRDTDYWEKTALMKAGIGLYSGRRYLYFHDGILDSWQEIN